MQPYYAFTKKVKGVQITEKVIEDAADIAKLDRIVQKLESLPRAMESALDQIGIRTNPRKWVKSLILGYPKHVNAAGSHPFL